MDGRFNNNPFLSEQEEFFENSPEDSADSPTSGLFIDSKMTSTSSPKRSRRSIQKRVVSVPIKEVEGSRIKGEMSAPPSDSWAWRKYGQKPIKGSPYPRGYYRCSSSKGCPARKQVERSRADPTMLLVTYSCEHNHSLPAARNNHRNHTHNPHNTNTSTAATTTIAPVSTTTISDSKTDESSSLAFVNQPELDHEQFLITTMNEFGWFSDLESTSSTMLESPILAGNSTGDEDVTVIFATREEDESLFADLDELPECSVVFRRGEMEREEEERRRCSLTRWCGTT